jgi:HEAT repeat protein
MFRAGDKSFVVSRRGGCLLAALLLTVFVSAEAAQSPGRLNPAGVGGGEAEPPIEQTVRELASIERRGPDLENLSYQEILRDSVEAHLVNRLKERLRRAGPRAHAALTRAALSCRRASTLKMLLEVMAELGVTGAVAPLARLAADPKTDVTLRRQLPPFLGAVGDGSTVAVLEALASESDLMLAKAAVFALGRLQRSAGLPALYRLLERGNAGARSAAAESLGEIDEFPSVERLVACLLDPDPYVRVFAQASLTELTYRYSRYQPSSVQAQHREWVEWWGRWRGQPRERLLAESLRENLAAVCGQAPQLAAERASWLAELSFQQALDGTLLESPLAGAALAAEAVRWREWAKVHGRESRREWFRQAIDGAVSRLQSEEAATSWSGLSALNEFLALPAGQPYVFRTLWLRTPPAERQRLASVVKLWWARNRESYDPRGKKFW